MRSARVQLRKAGEWALGSVLNSKGEKRKKKNNKEKLGKRYFSVMTLILLAVFLYVYTYIHISFTYKQVFDRKIL